MKRFLLLSIAGLSLVGAMSFGWADEEKETKGDKPIVKPREEVRKAEGEKDKPKDGEKRTAEKGDKPREGDKEKPREGEKARDGEKDKPRREGDGERKSEGVKDKPRETEKRVHPEAEAIEQRLRELHGQLKKHAEAGRQEEVARLKAEIGDVQRAFATKMNGGRGDKPSPHGERGEHVKIAVHQLQEAAEHLRAAGMPDVAEHIARQAKEIAHHQGRPDGEHPKTSPPKGERAEHRSETEERLHDLTNLVKKLNERIEHLERTK